LIYVDTSVLLPIYVLEAGSEKANRILEAASPIFISDLTVAEFHVALARKVKLGELSVSQSDAARASLESHLEESLLRRVALLSSHSETAGHLASKSTVILRTLDALHLAVATGLGASLLATFDGRLAEAARGLGFEVRP
jgi:predicted nucleic acid-binding protein